VSHLKRYDISSQSGVEAKFNREDADITDKKLRQIERLVTGEK